MSEYAVCWSIARSVGTEDAYQWRGPEKEPRPAPDASTEQGLNFMAEHGWELAFVTQPGPVSGYTLIFRRDQK
jgi:hypothetical protein